MCLGAFQAAAFEIDVSAELEEYIVQCVRCITLEMGSAVNFAEAGLLYSR